MIYYYVKLGIHVHILFLRQMILTCPSCSTHYKLDMAALPPEGQAVRCFKCKHAWAQNPSDLEDEAGDVAEDMREDVGKDIGEDIGEYIGEDDEPIDYEDFEPRPVNQKTGEFITTKPPSKIAKAIGWLLFLIIFGSGIGGGIFYRDMVRDVWPVSNKLYTLIGLGVEAPGTGLELRNVQSKHSKKDDAPFLTINGEIANISRKVRVVPTLSGKLTNSAGEPLHSWAFTIRQKNLLPGESVPFNTEVEGLLKGAEGLNITFLNPETMSETVPKEETGDIMEEGAAEEEETPSRDMPAEH